MTEITAEALQALISTTARAAAVEAVSDVQRPAAECVNVFSENFHGIALTLQCISATLKNIELSVGEIRDKQNEFDERIEAMEQAVEDLMRWKRAQWRVLAWIWGGIVAVCGYIVACVVERVIGGGK